jgi:hypothetical protein
MYERAKRLFDSAEENHYLVVWLAMEDDFPYAILELTEDKVVVTELDDGPLMGESQYEYKSTDPTYWQTITKAVKETPERLHS